MGDIKKPVGRPKKEATTNTPLTETQLYDVLAFAKEYYATANNYNGVYTPYLTNQRLGEITLTPKDIDEKELKNAFADPINNQDSLIGYSEWVQFTESISKRTLGYLGNLPSFDYTFVCKNITNQKEYQSKEYQDDMHIVQEFLDKFDVKGQFQYVHRRTMVDDSFYSVFRTDGNSYEFQELPRKYCKITGRNTEWGFLFDFDMNWFLRMGLSLDQYPQIFKRMYNDIFDNKGNTDYDPSNRLTNRDGTWSLWTQTSPLPSEGNFACFKFNSDSYASIPFLTPLFSDALNKPMLRKLQTDQYIIASQKLLIGLIPLLKEQKSGQVKDAFAVDPDTLGKFLGVLAQGLARNINVKPVPFSDVKDINFPLPEKNMYQDYSLSLSASSGVTSRLVYATDRQSAEETRLSAEIDSFIANSCYPQYAQWLSSMINSLTKHYKFKFKFEGTKFSTDKKNRLETAIKLADKGIVLPQKIASALGMDIFEFERQLDMGKASGLQDKLYLLLNSNTKDYGEDANGRPKKEMGETAESTDRNIDRIIE